MSERNVFFKAGIVFCAILALLMLAVLFTLHQGTDYNLSFGKALEDDELRRPANIFQSITGYFFDNNFYAVHASIILLVLFSLIAIILIHYFFERTSAPEILYIAIFAISLSFEILRFVLPLHLIHYFPSFYMRVASRILLFARFFGIFSLFAASICAAGLDVQKVRHVIFAIIITSLIITLGVPIDVLNWDTSLNMINGFSSMFRLIEISAFISIMISFFIAAKIRDSKEYTYVAIGIMLALFGRNILLSADNWSAPFLGIILLSFGTWFLCSKLHKIHLWL